MREAVVIVAPTVVVGWLDEPDSDIVLRVAVSEARALGAELLIATSYRVPIDPDVEDVGRGVDELARDAEAGARAALVRAARTSAAELPPHTVRVGADDTVQLLVDASRDASRLVVGTHQRNLLGRLFSGDTVADLVHRTKVPVLVVPTEYDGG